MGPKGNNKLQVTSIGPETTFVLLLLGSYVQLSDPKNEKTGALGDILVVWKMEILCLNEQLVNILEWFVF